LKGAGAEGAEPYGMEMENAVPLEIDKGGGPVRSILDHLPTGRRSVLKLELYTRGTTGGSADWQLPLISDAEN